jgi:hypothetical protein
LNIPPSTAAVKVQFDTDAFPQPHQGNPITLSHSVLTVTVPADIIQAGVDLGLITPQTPPVVAHTTFVLGASNATPAQHIYAVTKSIKIGVVGGKAQPLTASIGLPNTTWTPTADQQVSFSEKSLNIVSNIDIGFTVTATFDCHPSGTGQLAAVSAETTETPTTPTTPTVTDAAVTTTIAPAGTTTTTSSSDSSLPRTGAATLLLLVLAAAAIDIGIVLIGATRRRLHHR